MSKAFGPPLPAQPFIDWLNNQIDRLSHDETIASHTSGGATTELPTHAVLANRLGITSRTLYRYLNGLDGSNRPTETLGMYLVEDMLEHAGVRLVELYPEADVDIELEPDRYCETCKDTVTPIGGECPWCSAGKLTDPRQRRGGWTRPDRVATCKLTDKQLRALHKVYVDQEVSVNDLAKQVWEQAGYANYQACARGIYKGWTRLGLPARDRITAVRLKCTIHGMAPKRGERPGYKSWLRRRHQPDRPRCKATLRRYPRQGQPCTRPAMNDSEYCQAHDPRRELARQAHLSRARRKNLSQIEMLPLAPFMIWLEELRVQYGSIRAVAAHIGMEHTQCHRYAKGLDTSNRPKTTVSRKVVERSAQRLDTTVEAIYDQTAKRAA